MALAPKRTSPICSRRRTTNLPIASFELDRTRVGLLELDVGEGRVLEEVEVDPRELRGVDYPVLAPVPEGDQGLVGVDGELLGVAVVLDLGGLVLLVHTLVDQGLELVIRVPAPVVTRRERGLRQQGPEEVVRARVVGAP